RHARRTPPTQSLGKVAEASSFMSLFHWSGDHPDLHSFPTRRSSDLDADALGGDDHAGLIAQEMVAGDRDVGGLHHANEAAQPARSEERTSELQSRFDLVCRLLLEKKKRRMTSTPPPTLPLWPPVLAA